MMAAVKEVEKAIKSHQYVKDSVSYVLSPENKNGDEKCYKATCLNCVNDGADGLVAQFYETRRAFNKDDKILSHHYVQSFSPNENITPELAHQIGVELAEKVAPGYQVIVSTHVDKDHIHNHIIINSVNMETGMKWKADLNTRKNMRSESDKLCQQYGLTTIEKTSGLRGIDQTTQKLAEKGKSWKVDLCHALDDAVLLCNTKDEFIDFINDRGFEITRYTDRHITFHKPGEKKSIRADTLAKQFGDAYTKENLEKKMGFYRPPIKNEAEPVFCKKKKNLYEVFKSEHQKYEEQYFKENPPLIKPTEAEIFKDVIKNSPNPLITLLEIIIKVMIRRHKRERLDTLYVKLHSRCKKQPRYKMRKSTISQRVAEYENTSTVAGNIPYKNLMKAPGDNYRVRIALSAIPKLYAYPFFFSAKLYKDYAIVTIKEKDKNLLQRAMRIEDISVIDKHNGYYTPLAEYNDLKKRAEELDVKIEYLMLHQPEQLEKLKGVKHRFVALPTKEGKIRLAFLPQNKDFILHTLYPDKYKSEKDELFSVGRNSKVNTRLKSEALLGGKEMRYRLLSKEQVEQLAETIGEENFAVFNQTAKGESLNGKYNIVFKEDDTAKIDEALSNPPTTKRTI